MHDHLEPSPDCELYQVDFAGHDVVGLEGGFEGVPSFQDCQLKCSGVGSCTHVTFKPMEQLCFLKTSDAGKRKNTGASLVVSGPRKCRAWSEEPKLGELCLIISFDYNEFTF